MNQSEIYIERIVKRMWMYDANTGLPKGIVHRRVFLLTGVDVDGDKWVWKRYHDTDENGTKIRFSKRMFRDKTERRNICQTPTA